MFEGGDYGPSQFAGGGFMPTQSLGTQGNEMSSTPGKRSSQSGLRPVTAKQIIQANVRPQDDSFMVDGLPLTNITLVGRVSERKMTNTNITFDLDDGSGKVEIQHWMDSGDDMESTECASIINEAYVRVYGSIRALGEKRIIMAFAVKPVVDFNEITFHSLQCIFVHMYNVKDQGAPSNRDPSSQPMNSPFSPNTNIYMNTTNSNTPQKSMPQTMASNNMDHYASASPMASAAVPVTDLKNKILEIFTRRNLPDSGLNIDKVAAMIPNHPKEKIHHVLMMLTAEGILFNTIDDVTFQHSDHTQF